MHFPMRDFVSVSQRGGIGGVSTEEEEGWSEREDVLEKARRRRDGWRWMERRRGRRTRGEAILSSCFRGERRRAWCYKDIILST
jgi:hypothetical protein